jgi:hypothetical protein
MKTLHEFVHESLAIEGIHRAPTNGEIRAHEEFLELAEVQVPNLEAFVREVADCSLRDRYGMNVRVGSHVPPAGGPEIRGELSDLLGEINAAPSELIPWEAHVAYEQLHPFMDGNGRSGRMLWLWQRTAEGHDPFALGFLHAAYYEALDIGRYK